MRSLDLLFQQVLLVEEEYYGGVLKPGILTDGLKKAQAFIHPVHWLEEIERKGRQSWQNDLQQEPHQNIFIHLQNVPIGISQVPVWSNEMGHSHRPSSYEKGEIARKGDPQ